MRRIVHHDHGQKPARMKFLRIIFGCPVGARKWRILYFAMLLHSKKRNRQLPVPLFYGNNLAGCGCSRPYPVVNELPKVY